MAEPHAASNRASVVTGARSATRRSWADAVGVSILALLLLPAILTNALLWYEHLSGIGLYDRAAAGDPAWTQRPLVIPSLVAVAGVVRLALSRVWPVAARYRRILWVLTVVAVLVAGASQIHVPDFSYAPR